MRIHAPTSTGRARKKLHDTHDHAHMEGQHIGHIGVDQTWTDHVQDNLGFVETLSETVHEHGAQKLGIVVSLFREKKIPLNPCAQAPIHQFL